MSRVRNMTKAVSLCLAILVLAAHAADGTATMRAAAEILRDYKNAQSSIPGIQPPGWTAAKYETAIKGGCRRMARFAREMWLAHPRHPQLAEMLQTRWTVMQNTLDLGLEALAEIDGAIAGKTDSDTVRGNAITVRAWIVLCRNERTTAEKIQAIDEALLHPHAAKGYLASTICDLVTDHLDDPALQRRYSEKARALSAEYGSAAHGLVQEFGAPIRFEFQDPRDGRVYATEEFRGRYVVIHQWILAYDAAIPPGSDGSASCPEIDALAGLRDKRCAAGSTLEIVSCARQYGPNGSCTLREWATRHQVPWHLWIDDADFWEKWAARFHANIGAFHVVLDREGNFAFFSRRLAPIEAYLARAALEPARD
ncbi:MAG: hypothetical protein L0Z55_06760 [Planctomycetes bacterium]|nr:hypothetical protein [Planctomycetota bacterium]